MAGLYTAARTSLTMLGFAAVVAQAPGLSAAQRDTLARGEPVMTTEPRAGSVWPAVTVYLLIDAPPEQAAATFADFEAHAKYIPSIARSRVSRIVDSATIEVDYTLRVPIVSDEEYTVRDRLGLVGGSYRVDWTMVRASSTKAIVGHALFAPHTNARTGQIGTLLEYANFVTPGSRLAGIPFIRNRASAEVRETVEYIAREVGATKNSATMTARVAALRKILGAPR